MAYKVIILYRLYMPSYVLGTFTEYPFLKYGYGFILLEDAFYSGKFLIVLTRVYDLT